VLAWLSPYKGLLFVLVTSTVLYILVRGWADRCQASTRSAEAMRNNLHVVLDALPVGVLIADDSGTVIEISPAAVRLLDRPADDVVGVSVEQALGVVGRARQFGSGRSVAEAYDGLEVRSVNVAPGRALVVRASELDPSNRKSGAVLVLTDVTGSHRERERALRLARGYRFLTDLAFTWNGAESEAEMVEAVCYRAIEDGCFDASWGLVRDSATGRLRHTCARGLGHRALETANELVAMAESSTDPMPTMLRSGEVFIQNDLRRDPAGRWYAVAEEDDLGSAASFAVTVGEQMVATITLFARQVGYFEQEEVALMRTVQRGLSLAFERTALEKSRSMAEQQLAESEEAYRRLFNLNPVPMYIVDLESLRFLEVNDAAVERYGWSREEFLSMDLMQIRPEEDHAIFLDHLADWNGPVTDAGYWRHMDREGNTYTVHVVKHRLDWAGRSAELVMPLLVDASEPESAAS
jgi:PAS domain S-box-containing protein